MVSASSAGSTASWSTYEPTILNVQNAQDVYRLLSFAAHEDVSCLTLRPIE